MATGMYSIIQYIYLYTDIWPQCHSTFFSLFPPYFPSVSLIFLKVSSCSRAPVLLSHASLTPPICHDSNTASCWVILSYYLDSLCLLARLTVIHTWLRRDSPWLAVCPFPLTHSFSLVYIRHVNYLWAPQLNLLYSWCNTEIFTWAFGTEPGTELDLLFRSVFWLTRLGLAYTRLNSN